MPASASGTRILQFAAFQLNVATGELRKSGIPLRLRPQAAKVLILLASRAGKVISRDQLREAVWGQDVFVDFEHGLNLCIREIRATLDDDADRPRYIETLPRLGYRFVSQVEEVTSQSGPAQKPQSTISEPDHADFNKIARARRLAVGGALVLVVLALTVPFASKGFRQRLFRQNMPVHVESLAVLPLENLSHDADQEYFADGMTDELITELAKIHSMRIISRNSVMQYKTRHEPMSQIARELNVNAVVEGTVMRAGDRVRITAQLIAVPEDRHLWAETYERDMRDVLTLQDDIAQAIAHEVQAKLTPQEEHSLTHADRVNPEAYELYLKGRYVWAKRGKQNLLTALQFFQQAATMDPNYAPAWAGVAESYGLLGNNEIVAVVEVYSRAKSAALKAVQLDPNLSDAHAALAEVLNDYEWNWADAEKEYRRAIELDPSNANAHHWYAMSLMWVGRAAEAIPEIEHARALDPAGVHINANVGLILLFARQYDRAVIQAQRTLELEPNDATAHLVLAEVNLKKGNYQTAINELKTVTSLAEVPTPRSLAWLAWGYALAGHKREALSTFDKVKQLSRREYCPPTSMAMVYGALGQKDEAFAWLDKALKQREGTQLLSIKVNPIFDPLRSDPRFDEVLRRRGLPR